jgi:hypothetical protein
MESKPGSSFLIEHDLFRKPASTFRDHALDRLNSSSGFEQSAAARAEKRAWVHGCVGCDLRHSAGECLSLYGEGQAKLGGFPVPSRPRFKSLTTWPPAMSPPGASLCKAEADVLIVRVGIMLRIESIQLVPQVPRRTPCDEDLAFPSRGQAADHKRCRYVGGHRTVLRFNSGDPPDHIIFAVSSWHGSTPDLIRAGQDGVACRPPSLCPTP